MEDHVDHAVLIEIFRCLEPFGQLFADRLLDDAAACKADQSPGSAMWMSPSMA